jgi:dephospho-CoA kinase
MARVWTALPPTPESFGGQTVTPSPRLPATGYWPRLLCYHCVPMLQVGLTGNIATGKSQASRKFAELGARVIDADLIAHEILNPGTDTFGRILETFGREILAGDGTIDRRKLGNIVFSDPEKRFLLNRLTHPVIGDRIRQSIAWIERTSETKIVIIEAALMVEVGSYKRYHALVVVTCLPSIQLSRLIDRDNLSLEDAVARIRAQMPIEEKLKVADYSIDTSGSLQETHRQVDRIYQELLKLKN